jgi:hypothetical protein
MYSVKNFNMDKDHLNRIRECRKYNLFIIYVYKFFGNCFVECLGPTFFNSMPVEFKKNDTWEEKSLILNPWYINIYF